MHVPNAVAAALFVIAAAVNSTTAVAAGSNRTADAKICRMLALRFLPSGATLSNVLVEPAQSKVLQSANRKNGDPDHLGHSWYWYFVTLYVNVGGSKANVYFICSKTGMVSMSF